MKAKHERLQIFLGQLKSASRAGSAEDALHLLSKILNDVEDMYSGIPNNPESWQSDGRMYPPQEDMRHEVPGHPFLRRYRSAGHNTFIGCNGSIRIETCGLKPEILLEKPGRDGRGTHAQIAGTKRVSSRDSSSRDLK